MERRSFSLSIVILSLCLVIGFLHLAQAADYPSRDINLIITWAAGSNSDLAGRQFAAALAKVLGRNINIQNIGGGSGAIGMHQGAQARPDGYTLIYVTSGPGVIQPWVQKVSYDTTKDFIPIAQLFGEELAILSGPDAPYNNLREMVDFYKKSGTTPKYSTSGIGSSNHLCMILVKETIGLPMIHVPFSISTEAVNAVIGGSVPLANATPSTMIGPLKEGRIKVLAVFSDTRLDVFKDVPTAKEQGYNLAFSGWNGLMAPKGTPKEIVDILSDGSQKAIMDEALIKQSATVARPIDFLPGPQFGERIKRDLERNGRLIKAEGIGTK